MLYALVDMNLGEVSLLIPINIRSLAMRLRHGAMVRFGVITVSDASVYWFAIRNTKENRNESQISKEQLTISLENLPNLFRVKFIVNSSWIYGKCVQIESKLFSDVRNILVRINPSIERNSNFRRIIGHII